MMNDILSMRTKRTFISLEVHQIFMDHEDHIRPTHTHTHTHTHTGRMEKWTNATVLHHHGLEQWPMVTRQRCGECARSLWRARAEGRCKRLLGNRST